MGPGIVAKQHGHQSGLHVGTGIILWLMTASVETNTLERG